MDLNAAVIEVKLFVVVAVGSEAVSPQPASAGMIAKHNAKTHILARHFIRSSSPRLKNTLPDYALTSSNPIRESL
ncbi:MAG: hypothetical protein ACYC6B_04025 [Thermoleophilia bacterium]